MLARWHHRMRDRDNLGLRFRSRHSQLPLIPGRDFGGTGSCLDWSRSSQLVHTSSISVFPLGGWLRSVDFRSVGGISLVDPRLRFRPRV